MAPCSIEELVTYAQDEEEPDPTAMDLSGMQREVKRMAAAPPQIILLRLREQWDSTADPVLYKESEMEKQRWMLSALHNMDRLSPPPAVTLPSEQQRILALFETPGKWHMTAEAGCAD